VGFEQEVNIQAVARGMDSPSNPTIFMKAMGESALSANSSGMSDESVETILPIVTSQRDRCVEEEHSFLQLSNSFPCVFLWITSFHV
jgi:hypothetical protein